MASAFKCGSCGQRINISPQMLSENRAVRCPMCKTEQVIDHDWPGGKALETNQPASVADTRQVHSDVPTVSSERWPEESRSPMPSRKTESPSQVAGMVLMVGCALLVVSLFALLAAAIYLLIRA